MFDKVEKAESADDLVERGLAFHKQGRLAEARPLYDAALARDPGHAEAFHLMGLIAYQQGDFDDALSRIEAAIRHRPDVAKYHSNRGNALKEKGWLEDAIAAYRRAIVIDPDFADAPFNLGVALHEAGDAPGAAQSFQAALKLNPSNVDARLNMATVLHSLGWHDQSIDLFREVLKARPNAAEVHFNLSQTLEGAGRYAEAIAEARVALALSPAHAAAAAALHFLMRRCCAWGGMSEVAAVVDADIDAAGPGVRVAETPFLNVGRCDDPARNLAVARSWGAALEKAVRPLFPAIQRGLRTTGRQIRVGYMSSDMRNHAMGHLMRGFFGLHDRQRFHVAMYSYGRDDGSRYQHDIAEACDSFIDICDLAHVDAARRIHADGIDILVDLNGWTRGHRLAICAHRPAPIQVSYLGYPGTTGCRFIDYIIADSVVAPPEDFSHFSEAIVTMPHCYQVNDGRQPIAEGSLRRADAGLPPEGIVFCSFVSNYKIEPVMFGAWMRILDAVPGSVLWLLGGSDLTIANLQAEADRRGVAAERLILAPKLPKDEHLQRTGLADLALDTRIYNGHTTTSDALWAGVPVVALEGRHFASRVSSSCLKAIGLDELATPTLDAYEALAIRLARRPDEIRRLRERLETNRLTFPLFDTARFARHIEQAFEIMWRRHDGGERPAPIVVQP
ncbi:MAG: tetratricopeptide repeat protein [Rhodospirillales bacterium]|nr:tetratricopeptide repeat protein [Rhodospirillales bacterium]